MPRPTPSPPPAPSPAPATSASRRAAGLALTLLLAACDTGAPQHRPPPRESLARIAPAPGERQCLADLGARHASFTALPDEYFGGGCTAFNTVRLYSLGSDTTDIAVTNLTQVACPMATSFTNWARFGVDRTARQILGSRLVRIETMGSYSCRNIAGSDLRSAHATANAIDVSGFVLADGRRVTVLGGWNAGTPAERHFLRMIHASACKRFGTVLGPDYNGTHRNHFHLELSPSAFCR